MSYRHSVAGGFYLGGDTGRSITPLSRRINNLDATLKIFSLLFSFTGMPAL